MLAVRPMTMEDIPLVAVWMATVPLWQRYHVTTAAAQARFEQSLQRGDILLVSDWESESADRAVGFSWCLQAGAFGRSAYLRLIGVRPDHAGYGIGAELLAETERLVADFSKDLFLLVSDFNVDAQRFYQRYGYTQVGAIPGYVLPDVTELIFRKRLHN